MTDAFYCYLTKKVYSGKDLSTIAAGMSIALMMPASIDYGYAAGGAIFAMTVKHIFGGNDNYIFNPVAVTIAFFIISFPTHMLLYPPNTEKLPVFGSVHTALSAGIENGLMKTGSAKALSALDVLTGNFPGAMGTAYVIILIVSAFILLFRRSVSPTVIIATLFITIVSLPLSGDLYNRLWLELAGGYMLFGLLFLANDPQTVPKTFLGKIYYSVVLGGFIILTRNFGKVEGSFIFALLLANSVSFKLDELGNATFALIEKIRENFRKYDKSFSKLETLKDDGSVNNFPDTVEFESIKLANYNMLSIDNKIIKIEPPKKKFTFHLSNFAEKIVSLTRKEKQGTLPLVKSKGFSKINRSKIKPPRAVPRKDSRYAKYADIPPLELIFIFIISIPHAIISLANKIKTLGTAVVKPKLHITQKVEQVEKTEMTKQFTLPLENETAVIQDGIRIMDFEEIANVPGTLDVDN
jgi:electron transport complex protein RnfD